MNRGGARRNVYLDDADRRWFIEMLAEVHERFTVETVAYCLMGNHFHLLLNCPTGGLSSAMHLLGTMHTQRFNGRAGIDGSLFRGRFKSIPVSTESYLIELTRYIHRNPLEIGCGDLIKYPWSSFRDYLSKRPNRPWCNPDVALGIHNSTASAYESYVLGERVSEPQLDAKGRLSGYPGGPPTPDLILLSAIERVVAEVLHLESDWRESVPAGRFGQARSVVLCVAKELGVPTPLLVSRYHFASQQSARRAVLRATGRTDSGYVAEVLVRITGSTDLERAS